MAQPLAEAIVRVQEGIAELAGDTQQLVAMLVADAGGHRHRHDPAEDCRPECVDEGFVVREEQQQPIAWTGAQALQVMENAERTLVELAKTDAALFLLAIVIGDRAAGMAVGLQQTAQRIWNYEWSARFEPPGKTRV